MASTIARAPQSDPVRSLDEVRPSPAKAGLSRTASDPAVGTVIADAVVAHYGTVTAASCSLGENGQPVDPSQMMREFKKGNLARLDRDPDAKAAVASALARAFPDGDPKARARRLLRDLRRELDELADVI